MNRREFLKKSLMTAPIAAAGSFLTLNRCSNEQCVPNIVLMYADDLGYGDVSCYGAHRVNTPNIDRLAQEGLRFTNAYSTAATCTPSRYSLLTGEYAWRKKGTGIASGDASMIIDPDKTTLPDVLSRAGYKTGIVGKWHLGLGSGDLNWNKEIKPGPLELGFDYSFLIPATGDRVPCVYVENHHVVGLAENDPVKVSFNDKVGDEPTGLSHPELLKVPADTQHSNTIVNGISRIGYMSGGKSARWVDEDMADVITDQALDFIDQQQNNPFFLYFSFHDIHVPRVPNPRFVGKTDMGARGDAIVQLDWCVGQILNKLDELKLTENTLVIFSSDNGPVLNDGYEDEAVERLGDHKTTGPLRGGKYSSFEGGTRVPFVLRWPQYVSTGESDALISQVDLMASFAELVKQPLSKDQAIDSQNQLTALMGVTTSGRKHLVQQAMGGYLSLRTREWKYIPPGEGPAVMLNKNIETGRSGQSQLYHLTKDIGEKVNLAEEYPEVINVLQKTLAQIHSKGDRLRKS